MAQRLRQAQFDVVVLGGGASGVAAAAAAAKNGQKTLIIEAGPMLGGELLSGMSLDGVLNARGEYVVGGFSDELFDECRGMDGFVGPIHDHRLICYVCVDPEVMKIAVMTRATRIQMPSHFSTWRSGPSDCAPGGMAVAAWSLTATPLSKAGGSRR